MEEPVCILGICCSTWLALVDTVTDRAADAGVEHERPRPDGDEYSMEPGHTLLMLLLMPQKTNARFSDLSLNAKRASYLA